MVISTHVTEMKQSWLCVLDFIEMWSDTLYKCAIDCTLMVQLF